MTTRELEHVRDLYVCATCQGEIVTVRTSDGVTPLSIRCRYADGCDGVMFSQFSPAWVQSQSAGWEWYRPTRQALQRLRREDRATYDYVCRGGLLLRRVGAGGCDDEARQ